ncbi:hypothetical protein JOD51_002248 [Curtobacterium herbarum]|nr:hypothetical protein [Curtobacterium herbarum]
MHHGIPPTRLLRDGRRVALPPRASRPPGGEPGVRRAGENARCGPHVAWHSARSPRGRAGGTRPARHAPPVASCRTRGWRAGGSAPRSRPPPWYSARSRPRANVRGLRAPASGRERAVRSSRVLAFRPLTPRADGRHASVPATRLPSPGGARARGERARTRRSGACCPGISPARGRVLALRTPHSALRRAGANARCVRQPPWHLAHSRSGRTGGTRPPRPAPPDRQTASGRESAVRPPAHPGISPARARAGGPATRQRPARGPAAAGRDVRASQWKAGTIR